MGVLDKRLSQMPPPSPLPRIIRIATVVIVAVMVVVIYKQRDMLSRMMHPVRPATQSADEPR